MGSDFPKEVPSSPSLSFLICEMGMIRTQKKGFQTRNPVFPAQGCPTSALRHSGWIALGPGAVLGPVGCLAATRCQWTHSVVTTKAISRRAHSTR